jgi:hypothetical protein
VVLNLKHLSCNVKSSYFEYCNISKRVPLRVRAAVCRLHNKSIQIIKVYISTEFPSGSRYHCLCVTGLSSIPALFHASEVLASPDKVTKADADKARKDATLLARKLSVDGRRLTLTDLSEWTRDYGQNSAGASANVDSCSNCVVTQVCAWCLHRFLFIYCMHITAPSIWF